jgi:hypothetical protein
VSGVPGGEAPWVKEVKLARVEQETAAAAVGLCLTCVFAQRIQSPRGSIFFLCERSRTDPAFPRYPRLPVLQCVGYVREEEVST